MKKSNDHLSKFLANPRLNALLNVTSVIVILYFAYKIGHEAGRVLRSVMEMFGLIT